jgi:hypothetical protein
MIMLLDGLQGYVCRRVCWMHLADRQYRDFANISPRRIENWLG